MCTIFPCVHMQRSFNKEMLLYIPLVLPTLYLLLAFALYVYRRFIATRQPLRSDADSLRTCVVLGSGGHTGEMIPLLNSLDHRRYSPRDYVVADTDAMSIEKAHLHEKDKSPDYCVHTITRSREVKQSYITSVLSTLRATVECVPLLYRINADLLLVNGPGTCLPVCLVTQLLNALLFRHTRAVFIESLCRVQTLSTTAKLLYHLRLVDALIVQWPQLQYKYPRAHYIGRL